MKKILEDIENYIRFLELSGYTISISFCDTNSYPWFIPLLQYDFHPHGICNYLKHNKKTEGMCVLNKKKLMKKDIKKPYYGCCYAGVEEFLVPVRCDDVQIACIHVSGFRGQSDLSRLYMKKTEELVGEPLDEIYSKLSENPPTLAHVLSFVQPLVYMLNEFYRTLGKENIYDGDKLYYKALSIIYENGIEKFSCRELAKKLNYSESYLRQIFKKSDKVSLQAKINQIRLEKAKRLLRGTNSSVMQIAFSVGFSDSNYFSTFFKKHTGLTPLAYRRNNQEK